MKVVFKIILAVTIFSFPGFAFHDPILSADVVGEDCKESDADFFESEINSASSAAAYLCLSMSMSGVSPGTVQELCAGARNDERHPREEVDQFVSALAKNSATADGGCAALRLTRGAKPGDQVQQKLEIELSKICAGENYAENRTSFLERLHQDLAIAIQSCADVARFERNEILRSYNWPKIPATPTLASLESCRTAIKAARNRSSSSSKLIPQNEALIRLLEATPRFIERTRGLTLQPDPKTLNFVDLHYMAKQAFENLENRIQFISAGKKPSDEQLQDFANNDPDFANTIACQYNLHRKYELIPKPDSRTPRETFKKKIIEKFVLSYARDNRFAAPELHHMDSVALEEMLFLVGTSQFQRAIWLFEDKTDSLDLREYLEKMTKGMRFSKSDLPEMVKNKGLGANDSYRVTLPYGIRGIYKPFVSSNTNPRFRENFEGENAVNAIDKILQLRVAPTSVNIFIDGKEGSFQFFVTNALTPASMDISREIQMGEGVAKKSWQINFLDMLVLNSDRQNNLANMMIVLPERRRVAIDNGLAFTAKKTFPSLELLHPKADSSAFIPRDLGERKFLAKRLDKYIDQLSNTSLIVHDDDRLNQCGKMISQAAASSLSLMLQKCGNRSDKDCNTLGAERYNLLVNDQSFLRNYNALECGS